MNIEKYLILFCYFLLLKPEASRYGAFVLITAFAFYMNFVIGKFTDQSYYIICAVLQMAICLLITSKYFFAGLMSFFLIFANIYGYIQYINGIQPDTYDNICLILIFIQMMLIAGKGAIHGLIDNNYRVSRFFRFLFGGSSHVFSHYFNSRKSCVKMLENSTKKEGNL